MWDRPELLNRDRERALSRSRGCSSPTASLWIVVHHAGVRAAAHRGERRARSTSRARRSRRSSKPRCKGTFFTLNLPQVRSAFEKLPWVREVKLRRRWPDRLEVSVTEHVPLARWGNAALVNTQGEIFHAAYDGKLPRFIGPPGTSKEIAIQYRILPPPARARSARSRCWCRSRARRAWQVRVEGGPTLELGREDVEARLARYLDAHERTLGTLKRLDLRAVETD